MDVRVKNSVLFQWVVGLVILAVTAVVYMIQFQVSASMGGVFETYLVQQNIVTDATTLNCVTPSSLNCNSATTYKYIRNVEQYWPLVILVGIIIYWIAAAMRIEPTSYPM